MFLLRFIIVKRFLTSPQTQLPYKTLSFSLSLSATEGFAHRASLQSSMDMDMDFPPLFRCPISMELMEDPVTISTGVTYERKSIEKWFFTYNKNTCPATMQTLAGGDFVITPNLTLKRLILAWKIRDSCSSPPAGNLNEVRSLLATIESSPFKASSLRKLRSMIEMSDEIKSQFIRLSNGIGIIVNVIDQILIESSDFSTFEACEEALGVMSQLPISKEDKLFDELSKRECMKSIAIVLQRGSAEGRLYAVKILRNIAKNTDYNWNNSVLEEEGMDFFKPLLELVSDELCTKASSCALDVMIEILGSLKKSRQKAIEAGAVWVLIELLPESRRSKCERMLHILQSLCECAEGRLAVVEHAMGIAAVTKKILNVSNGATKMGVKILLLVCSFHPKERVLEEMMACGSVKKLLMILHMDGGGGRSSTKEKVIKILKLHGNSWRRNPCFPCELKDYLKFVNDN